MPSSPRKSLPIGTIAGALWLAGAGLFLWRAARSHHELGRRVRGARPVTDEPRCGALATASAALSVRTSVRLLESERVFTPMVAGWRAPALLLPPDSTTWSPSALRAVLLHEVAHVRRQDVAWQLAGTVARALLWFHPLVWWAEARLRTEGERAADEAAIAAGERPSRYARTLLRLASASSPYAAAGFARRDALRARLERILSAAPRKASRAERMMLGALAVTVALATSFVQPVPARRAAAGDAFVRSANVANSLGAPVRIARGLVVVAPYAKDGEETLLLVRPRLVLVNRTEHTVESVLVLLDNRHTSRDVVRIAAAIEPGGEAEVSLDAVDWSQEVEPGDERDFTMAIVGVQFENGDRWDHPDTDQWGVDAPAVPPVPPVPALDAITPAPSSPRAWEVAPVPATPGDAEVPTPAPTPGHAVAPTPGHDPDLVPDHAPAPTPAPSPQIHPHLAPITPQPGALPALPQMETMQPTPRAPSIESAPPVPAVPTVPRERAKPSRFRNAPDAPLIVLSAQSVRSGRHVSSPLVKLRNVSDRRIVGYKIRFQGGADEHGVSGVTTDLAPGETCTLRSGLRIAGHPETLTVQVLGVRFADGGTWGSLDETIDGGDPWIGDGAPE
jgi:beta-lactamase regulating signal transducer with metallopeptidase domain